MSTDNALRAGFGKVCVTPPLGMPMEGLGQQGGIERTHDDLYIRALYLSHGGQDICIVGCDLLFLERPDLDRMKEAIRRKTGLAPEQVLLNFSHTHAGPRLTTWSYSGVPDPAYLDTLEEAFADAVAAAQAYTQPVTMWAGMAQTQLPVSRRQPDTEGKAQWAPYRDGIVCTALPFCLFKDAQREVVSLLFSVSCHPSMIYTLDASADYPGVAMRRLNEHFHSCGALFLQGAGGDTKPRQIAVEEERWRAATWEEVEAAGTEVADAVIARVGEGLTEVQPNLRNRTMLTDWPLEASPTREYLTKLAADPATRSHMRSWAEEMLDKLDRGESLPTAIQVRLHALQLGEGLRLIGLEGELVGELGNRILNAFPTGVTFPMGYTDGCIVYLPSSRMLPEGGYEVDSYWEYHHPAQLAPGMEGVIEEALDALKKEGM
ncbi:MAG: hypothetical protein ACYC7E_10455 [Armatimonadota bacterium]